MTKKYDKVLFMFFIETQIHAYPQKVANSRTSKNPYFFLKNLKIKTKLKIILFLQNRTKSRFSDFSETVFFK